MEFEAVPNSNYIVIKRVDATGYVATGNSGSSWKITDQANIPTGVHPETGLPNSNQIRAWRFIPEKNSKYPTISTKENPSWYYLRNVGAEEHAAYLEIATEGKLIAAGKELDEKKDAQLFRFENNPASEYAVNIVSKKEQLYIDASLTLSQEESPWLIRTAFVPHASLPDQLVFYPTAHRVTSISAHALGVNLSSKEGILSSPVAYFYNTAHAWALEAASGNSGLAANTNQSGINIYHRDGHIIIEGTDEPALVYTVTGVRVDVDRPLPSGIYLVKVAGRTSKVLIN